MFNSKHKNKVEEFSIMNVLKSSLEDMNRQGVDRIVLSVGEIIPESGGEGWTDISETTYYPFEILPESEKNMMRAKKSYQVSALVLSKPCGIPNYSHEGLEVIDRTRFYPLREEQPIAPNLPYLRRGGVHGEETLNKFVKWAASNGLTAQLLKSRIDQGFKEYHAITKKLMRENRELQHALEIMENRH